MEGYLISWIFYDLWIVYLFINTKTHSYKFLKSNKVGLFTFFILFLLIVYGEYSGDFRNYEWILDKFSSASNVANVATNFEPVYLWIASITRYNVILFRAVIGFVMIIAVYNCFKVYDELNLPAVFLFTLIPFYYFSNTIRQGLADSTCLLGLFLWFNNRNKLLSTILILESFFLHKSTLLIIPALIFLSIPLTKRNIKLFILALIPLISLENILFKYFTGILLGDGVISLYMGVTSEGRVTFFMKFMDAIILSSISIITFLSLKRIYKKNSDRINKPLELITRLLFGCYYMYIIYSCLNLDLNYVSERFIPFIYVPLVIVMMKAYGIRILKNQVIVSLLMLYFIFINLQIYRWFLVFF